MIILLKIIFVIVVLFAISPFIGMVIAFGGGALVAPGTPKREFVIGWIVIYSVLALVYIGFPLLIFLI